MNQEIDLLISRFYSAFDNRNARRISRDDFTDLFHERTIIAKSNTTSFECFTVDEFLTPRINLLNNQDLINFYEYETSQTTEIFENLAFRHSKYKKFGILNNTPYSGTGTKFFQLIKLPSGWRILSFAWSEDNA